MKHFHKIDKHLQYDQLLIVAIVAFFIGFFLRKLGTDGQIIEGAFGLLGIITLFLAIVDFIRHKSK
ncbi:MAG: hypothetical protein WCG20_03630 [bacterium]